MLKEINPNFLATLSRKIEQQIRLWPSNKTLQDAKEIGWYEDNFQRYILFSVGNNFFKRMAPWVEPPINLRQIFLK